MLKVSSVDSFIGTTVLLESGKIMHKGFIGIFLSYNYRLTEGKCFIINKKAYMGVMIMHPIMGG